VARGAVRIVELTVRPVPGVPHAEAGVLSVAVPKDAGAVPKDAGVWTPSDRMANHGMPGHDEGQLPGHRYSTATAQARSAAGRRPPPSTPSVRRASSTPSP
jgi:hypothetical protein